ncbi:MAG: hypothetical protein GQ553_01850 [Nitrosomonadaceae bacterium]|nr:hypothetical protein [Nitrosomonadaceae bacterium]
MADAAFISTANLKKEGLINGNVEDSILRVVIQRVQRSVVRPLLGTSLYNRIVTGITDDDLNADEKVLMDDYVTPLMVVACDRASIDATNYQIRNKSVSTGVDADFKSVTESENLRLDNSIRQSITIEQNTLIDYLLDNCDLYPEYNNAECSYEMKPPSTRKSKGNSFYMT